MKHDTRVFIVVCGGCPEGAKTGTPEEVERLKGELAAAGKKIVGDVRIDFLCNKALVGTRLSRKVRELKETDAVLIMSCGIGVQATAEITGMKPHPVLNTMSMGGFQGLFMSSERCMECGECVLTYTGGICPITTCSKSLLNGQCGGAKAGKCEVSKERPCGWQMIWERTHALGTEEALRKVLSLRSYTKWDFPNELRTTVRWALEMEEKVKPAEAQSAAKAPEKRKKEKT
jgi:electron transport complex protein RnfC